MKTFFQRLIGIIKKHKHNIFIKCLECGSYGTNIPNDFQCQQCGSFRTTEYYPTRNMITYDFTKTGRKKYLDPVRCEEQKIDYGALFIVKADMYVKGIHMKMIPLLI